MTKRSGASPANSPLIHQLSRREQQVMDGLYQHGPSTVADVIAFIPHPPSYSAVRALLRTLEAKGHVRHRHEGNRYVYEPMTERRTESRFALRHLVQTFFGGSPASAVAALLDDRDALTPDEVEQLRTLIDTVSREQR